MMKSHVFVYETVDSDGDTLTIWSDGTWRWSCWSPGDAPSLWQLKGNTVWIKHPDRNLKSRWQERHESQLYAEDFLARAIKSVVTEWALLGEDDE